MSYRDSIRNERKMWLSVAEAETAAIGQYVTVLSQVRKHSKQCSSHGLGKEPTLCLIRLYDFKIDKSG